MGHLSRINCYKVLALESARSSVPTASHQAIRDAYRRALLRNHPDKVSNTKAYTIDDITYAYKTLSDPEQRLRHDKQLKCKVPEKDDDGFDEYHTGFDTADLGELHYDNIQKNWHRDCRCGDSNGFTLNEDDLRKSIEQGEVVAECPGCSLRLRVAFAVADDG
ncbi:MAG: hypothetical protein Q9207_000595 [Kuettlingeria erythrocarpa]